MTRGSRLWIKLLMQLFLLNVEQQNGGGEKFSSFLGFLTSTNLPRKLDV
jgi:hypothetical protein